MANVLKKAVSSKIFRNYLQAEHLTAPTRVELLALTLNQLRASLGSDIFVSCTYCIPNRLVPNYSLNLA